VNRAECQAAAVIRECRAILDERGATILHEVAGGVGNIPEWRRYPDGEVFDPVSHTQFFYHSHPSAARAHQSGPAEHGHFHLFLRAEGMPSGVAPLLLPELAVADAPVPPQAAPVKHGARDEVSHVVAIALDARGEPIRLFTTNRWVTGETWYGAEDVIRMLDRFKVESHGASALLSRWLGAVVQLFRPEIAGLLRQRDETVMGWRRRRRTNVFEDSRLEITSLVDVDLDARLAAAEYHVADTPRSAGVQSLPRLPPMAEGWGV
jgi:hypothetical protein